jgi:hypothetical protein
MQQLTPDVINVLFPEAFVNALLGILALITIDLVFGVAVALKTKIYAWSQLADFYRTSVMPGLLGWAVADIVLRLAALRGLPIVASIEPLATGGLYVIVLVALLAQIGTKLNILRGSVQAAG